MNKNFYTLFFAAMTILVLLPTSMKAQNTDEVHDEYLVIYMEDQSKSVFLLDEYPVITFEDDSVVVNCQETQITIAYAAISDVCFVTEDGTPTAIDDIISDNPRHPDIKSGEAYFTDLEPGSRIRIHDMQGNTVATISVGADGKAVVNLRAMPKGVYILATKNYCYKIVNP